MSTPILEAIVGQIKTVIGTMTTLNGYAKTYGSVDEMIPSARTYPAVFIDYPQEVGLDDAEAVLERYTTDTEISIRVIMPTSTNLDAYAHDVIADFTKAMETNRAALKTAGLIKYDYVSSATIYREVKAYPAEVIIKYKLNYRRQKITPYST